MKTADMINALKVMSTVMKAAGLEHKPADLMIISLQDQPFYDDTDLQRAFLAGWMVNYKSLADMTNIDFVAKFEQFKKEYIK